MKKVIAILLLTVYTGSLQGAIINYHYCQGHLAKISLLNFGSQKSCSCNTAHMPKGCCNDEMVYQKKDNHEIVQPVSISQLLFVAIRQVLSNNHDDFPICDGLNKIFLSNFFERSYSQPIFLLDRVFRI